MTTILSRHQWTALTDDQLLAQCVVDTYRASGPGGQKRQQDQLSGSARHPASGLLVIAEESRSQHENKARAQADAPGPFPQAAGRTFRSR